MERREPENKNLSDPNYNLSDFMAQAMGGSLRWLATVFALAGFGLWLVFVLHSDEPEISFPIHLKGKIVLWVIGLASVFWLVLAMVKWARWLKRKKL